MKKKDLKTSVFSRSTQLINMASRLAAREASNRFKRTFSKTVSDIETRVKQAEILVNHLSQLKGAAMKAGQLLSLDSSDLLPAEAAQVLSKLQAQSEAVEMQDMLPIVKSELGEKFDDFSDFSENAQAAASIGQVHSATLDGQKVALKIQYPDIEKSIDSDIDIIRRVVTGIASVSGKDVDLTELFEEFKTVLRMETDYGQELAHLQEFYQLTKGDNRFRVPISYPSYSTRKVLCMSWEEGQKLDDWINSHPTYAEREQVGRNLLDLYCLEFYKWGLVQTDPNYGNFLIDPDSLQIVLLDFGATLRYSAEFRERYVRLLKTLKNGTKEEVEQTAITEGLMDPRESAEAKEHFTAMLKQAVRPFRDDLQPFVFADPSYETEARNIGLQVAKDLRYTSPPRELIFLHRKLGGLFNLMRKLELEMDLTPYWDKLVSH